jgi:3-oxoacyl-[acyl-carrier protein] reductase
MLSKGERDLEGCAAIVTGSARNIGRAIALDLAAGGASVLINGVSSRDAAEETAAMAEAAGGRAIVHMADVTDPEQVDEMIAAAADAFGRIDFLVNNVSMRSECPVGEMPYDLWRQVLASTLDAAFLCTRAALPYLEQAGQAAIVNIGGAASHAGMAERAHVAAAKAGLCGMTGALAVELGPKDITVNCVVPSMIHTDRQGAPEPPHFAKRPAPMGRMGNPEEIASVVRFLCGPGARYISGQSIHANGAWYVTV